MKNLTQLLCAVALLFALPSAPAIADTGLVLVCSAVTARTQALNCSTPRYWSRPTAGEYVFSYPTVAAAAAAGPATGYGDLGLAFREWSTISPSQSVDVCATDIPAESAVTIANDPCTATDWIAQSAVVTVPTGSALVAWAAPTNNTDGSSFTDLVGYNLYEGANASEMMAVESLGLVTTYMVSDLPPGSYSFAVTAVNNAGIESPFSAIVSKTVLASPQ